MKLKTFLRPAGGFTTLPSLRDGADARPLCEAAAARGVVMSPGDCFGVPSHFRIGFGEGYADALELVSKSQPKHDGRRWLTTGR